MKFKLTIVFALIVFMPLFGQKKIQRELVPARGHYNQLSKLSAEPKSKAEETDTLKFPFNAASAERRLSFKPIYLNKVSPDDFKIPDPPANSSEQTRAELNYLLSLQAQRTSVDTESSLFMAGVFYNLRTIPADSNYSRYRQNIFFIGRSIGTWFNPENLPVTADFMARVWQDASYFIWSLKYKYLRVRPYVLEPDLKNLEDTNWAAYPSGHAANSYINAFIYQELAPQFVDVFNKDAYDMAHSREIIGVHYPSDSEASRILARQLVNKLFENEKFRADFDLVKKEWAEKAKETFTKQGSTLDEAKKKSSSCAKTCE